MIVEYTNAEMLEMESLLIISKEIFAEDMDYEEEIRLFVEDDRDWHQMMREEYNSSIREFVDMPF